MSGFLAQTGLAGLGELSLLQRMLLVCDGTLTDMVEAAFLEPIRLVKIAVETAPSREHVEDLGLERGALLMTRKIFLQGSTTGTNYVYAESLIAVDALPAAMRDELLQTDAPLGRLWVQHKLETRKEILRIWRNPGGQLGRSYRVFSGGRPIMIITEYFPAGAPAAAPTEPRA